MIPALQGYLAAIGESLADSGTLAEAGAELGAVADLVERNAELLLVLVDASIPLPPRRAVLADLLEGRFSEAVTEHALRFAFLGASRERRRSRPRRRGDGLAGATFDYRPWSRRFTA